MVGASPHLVLDWHRLLVIQWLHATWHNSANPTAPAAHSGGSHSSPGTRLPGADGPHWRPLVGRHKNVIYMLEERSNLH